ncbi:major facilitator superfamily domain-containing protein [Pseudomassariella vexata]|uniref:Major facilitator superfamily domain-containing protein n=1 Tax=Pseudomassariella vexata TaxID=1141098 RepID=A0A1Y2DNN7_9PEZI|nr:major facilitator superfamily domain-containing protein [Pseudomassariella vexata]ORY60860.1 major facilitator superfamily domain-containing protein [Pseudomassariella vexata]
MPAAGGKSASASSSPSIERLPPQQQTGTDTSNGLKPDPAAVADMEKGTAAVPQKPGPPPGMAPSDFPDGGLQAWTTVFGGWCGMFCTFGLINCIGVFLEYYVQALPNYDTSAIAWITSVQIFVQSGGTAVWGRLFDNYGPKWLLIIGTITYCFGMMMTSLSTQYYQYFLAQSIVASAGSGAVFNSCTSSTATWFFKRRALAIGLVASGSSLGGVILPIMMNHLIPRIGFPWTMRVLGFMFLGLCGISCLTVTSRLPPRPKPVRVMDYVKPFREPAMLFTILGGFFFLWGMFLPFNYLILQARAAGVSESLTTYLIPILNAVSIFGRIIPGAVADKVGRYNTMICITMLSGIITLGLWIPGKSAAAIIVYGAIFGFTSGSFISLAPACIAQVSDIREIGTRTGTALFVQSLGALTGSPIAGALISRMNGRFLGLQIFCGIVMLVSTCLYSISRTFQVGLKPVKC